VGDPVIADDTIVAAMLPTLPGFLDVRSREELHAALAAADSAVQLAEHEVQRIESAFEFARGELQRAQSLAQRDIIAAKALDKAKVDVETNEHALASAKAQLAVRRSERASIAVRLTEPSENRANLSFGIQLRAPVSGRVLRIHQESESVVQAGTPLVDIGDPGDLEVVADFLSPDAVQIEAGSPVRISGWGGPALQGRVRRIDPAGFTKVSALGIEEQRVGTVIDFVDPPKSQSRLGHDFRVIVHVTTWSAKSVVTVPVGALFRRGESWAVFAVRDGRAHVTPVQIGQRNNRVAEVLTGLSAGDQVVLHPSDRIAAGTAVTPRVSR
jgi:HlyD family secretion protein